MIRPARQRGQVEREGGWLHPEHRTVGRFGAKIGCRASSTWASVERRNRTVARPDSGFRTRPQSRDLQSSGGSTVAAPKADSHRLGLRAVLPLRKRPVRSLESAFCWARAPGRRSCAERHYPRPSHKGCSDAANLGGDSVGRAGRNSRTEPEDCTDLNRRMSTQGALAPLVCHSANTEPAPPQVMLTAFRCLGPILADPAQVPRISGELLESAR